MDINVVKLLDKLDPVIITGGLIPRGVYDNSRTYEIGDSVSYLGASYVLYATAVAGTLPTDTTYWQSLLDNIDIAANWGNIIGTLSNQTDLQAELDSKVDDSQVLTDVPSGALFTDTVYDDTDIQNEVNLNTAKISYTDASDVSANTSARHDAVTVTDSSEIDFTLTGQDISANIINSSIDETKLDTSVNASLDLADSAIQTHQNIAGKEDVGVAEGLITTHESTYDHNLIGTALQSFTEEDPIFLESEAFNIVADDITNLSNLSGTNTGDVSVTDSSEIDFTLTLQDLTASLKTGSIDVLKLDSGVQTSLGLADSAVQPLALDSYQLLSEKAQNNGYASLDAGGKIPSSQLPSTVMDFKGNWNATTNTPTLADGTGDAGDVYLCNVSGTQDLGSGSIVFSAGDWVVYSGTIWEQSINSNAVVSVNSQTGVVSLDTGDVSSILNNRYVTDLDLTNLSNLSGDNTGDQDLSGYVPYIGATCSVNLNNKTLVNVNALGVGTDTPSYDVDVMGTGATSIVNSNNGFRTLTVDNPSGGFGTRTVQDGGSLEASKLYYYQITYVTAVGETASYPNQSGTVTTTATDKSVLLEGLPVSSDYRVITKNIYRTKADASPYTYYLVDSIPNATTSYLDTKADASLDTNYQSYFRDNTTSIFLKNGDVTIFAPGEKTYRSGYNVGNDVTNSGRSAYAGASVASIGSQGSDNAMFGYGIGYNATFSSSVALGTYVFGALSSSYSQATGIGYGTLFGAYGQSRNINYSTAVGYQAGGAGCPYLTAVGNSAGGALQGSANSFVGAYAGKGASGATAASNSGIGFYVLNGLTTGYGNVGIGRDSGKANTSGSYNSYLGSFSASYQTTGSYNAYLGFAAGRYSTDQSCELFINSYDRTDRAGDIAKSIIYGIQTSAGTGQELYLNSSVFVKEDVKAVNVLGNHKTTDGTAAVSDGTYTMGIGATTNGTITIKDGLIISVTEAVD